MFDFSATGILSTAFPRVVFKSWREEEPQSAYQSKYPLAIRQRKLILGLSEHVASCVYIRKTEVRLDIVVSS